MTFDDMVKRVRLHLDAQPLSAEQITAAMNYAHRQLFAPNFLTPEQEELLMLAVAKYVAQKGRLFQDGTVADLRPKRDAGRTDAAHPWIE